MAGRFGIWAASAAALLTLGAAPMVAPPPGASGYLGPALPDTYAVLPPSPAPGSPREEADQRVFRGTRALKDTPRWALAQNDANQAAIVQDLACAIGAELTPRNAPRTFALILKMAPDVSHATNRPKDIYKRPRPYLLYGGEICVPKTPSLAASPDYPSGHNAWGWAVGLVMAELAPDRATPILMRARAFGESRLVCGVHSLSAVQAGRLNGSMVVAALHGDAAFRADMDAARAEVAAARRRGPFPDPAACAREASLVAQNPY
ncbi:MAG TPA: phosphatase PAP2 family protein [Phenylobacterium sp.]|uniref:acid phosphatase n=1 Tax=Phenylobacterium sp. TaxID=1871053 RepID=UPI002CA5A7EB|nr:phosphatase PAP2 family protein [Phenylobacterium sp.]HSV03067.1 phosphatase PAP2 family protein [Phenylobacterium sp.]